jgi:hypothetical protein
LVNFTLTNFVNIIIDKITEMFLTRMKDFATPTNSKSVASVISEIRLVGKLFGHTKTIEVTYFRYFFLFI